MVGIGWYYTCQLSVLTSVLAANTVARLILVQEGQAMDEWDN